ncbi:hypothetical protein [Ferviditalea candida]|uniref:SHSP domain-containing protein n=1 Tax=Ferviditalea candida TaxID=3108399 RepID=A0ABU5ZCT5_9BACL|nr:hypothetical protein [Paenibacillaceae bacterium T2]
MPLFPFGFLQELDRINRKLYSESVLHHMVSQWHEMLLEGPNTEVYHQGDRVKVVVETQSPQSKRYQWSMRVNGRQLYLQGTLDLSQSVSSDSGGFYSEKRTEQIAKAIVLPIEVNEHPLSVDARDGRLTILFEAKRKSPARNESN